MSSRSSSGIPNERPNPSAPARAAMPCPRCAGEKLTPIMSKQGVEVDACPTCGGVWLDRGEIFYFTSAVKPLVIELKRAQADSQPGELLSPATGNPMQRVMLFQRIEIDWCRDTDGLWVDRGELAQITQGSEAALRLALDPEAARPRFKRDPDGSLPSSELQAYATAARPLPNLLIRSAGLVFALYALLGALLITAVELGYVVDTVALGIGIAFAVLQFLLSPWIMDLTLGWFYSCGWVEPGELPAHLNHFIQRVCRERGMRFPRMGIIEDGAPNAFTYGHVPGNARIVITRGLFDLLDEKELEAVVAHEIGHAVQWDMVLMTVAQLVPLVAYYVYRTAAHWKGRGRDQIAQVRIAVQIGAYLVYVISEYIVLWLSRTREYRADAFAGQVTGNPNLLAAALVKIGYGLAGQEHKAEARSDDEAKAGARGRRPGLEAIGALGIFDGRVAHAFAVSAAGAGRTTTLDQESLRGAMRWDLWNPWARFYELHSTHPLIANRLDYLSRQAASMRMKPLVVFDEQRPESYWDEFLVDLFVMALPALLAMAGLATALFTGQWAWLGLALALFGVGALIKTWFSYRTAGFPPLTVAGLLKNVKVSGVRGVPCSIRGTVIGRGVPGLIWSEDFVIRDRSGIIFLDYRQPLRIWEFLFGLMRRTTLDGADVTATGWYRRSPTPYIELRSITTSCGTTLKCYVLPFRILVSFVLVMVGFAIAAWLR